MHTHIYIQVHFNIPDTTLTASSRNVTQSIHTYIHTCIYIYIYIYIYIFTHIHTDTHNYTYTYLTPHYSFFQKCHVVHIYIHIHTHTHIYTHQQHVHIPDTTQQLLPEMSHSQFLAPAHTICPPFHRLGYPILESGTLHSKVQKHSASTMMLVIQIRLPRDLLGSM